MTPQPLWLDSDWKECIFHKVIHLRDPHCVLSFFLGHLKTRITCHDDDVHKNGFKTNDTDWNYSSDSLAGVL